MQRVLVIGCSGAGKSTFAKKLAERTGLPLVHLDQLYWQPGWQKTPDDLYAQRLQSALEQAGWIIGSNSSTLPMRLKRADTVIWLDLPRWRCLSRVLKRVTTSYGKVRPDAAPGCPERVDLEFLRYIWSFHRLHNPRMARALDDHGPHVQLYLFTSDREAQAFLDGLS